MKKTIDELVLVNTHSKTYLGQLIREDEHLVLEKAATIVETDDPKVLAHAYFVESAKRKLQTVEIPLSAVESVSPQPQATILYKSYEELSRDALREGYGKAKIKRLEKMLGGGYR